STASTAMPPRSPSRRSEQPMSRTLLLSRVLVTTAIVLSTVTLAWPGRAGVQQAAAETTTPSTQNRYTLVHGCYALRSGTGLLGAADSPYRMQATTLGVYLLYGVHGDFLAQTSTGLT